jgi:hypothetical protein
MQVFMASIRKGIPFRRGVSAARCAGKVRPIPDLGVSCHVLTSSLSGKTLLIHSLAGELGLDIYVVSLSSKGCVIRLFPLLSG